MLKCEPTAGQVHVLSHPISHNLVKSSPSLQVSFALLVLLKEWPHDYTLTQKTASLAELPPRCPSVAAGRMCIHALG